MNEASSNAPRRGRQREDVRAAPGATFPFGVDELRIQRRVNVRAGVERRAAAIDGNQVVALRPGEEGFTRRRAVLRQVAILGRAVKGVEPRGGRQ